MAWKRKHRISGEAGENIWRVCKKVRNSCPRKGRKIVDQQKGGDIPADSEKGGVTEGKQARVTEKEVEAQGEDPHDHNLGNEHDAVGLHHKGQRSEENKGRKNQEDLLPWRFIHLTSPSREAPGASSKG